MKRILTKTIDNCKNCHFFDTSHSATTYEYKCTEMHLTVDVFNDISADEAEEKVKEWFKSCTILEETT